MTSFKEQAPKHPQSMCACGKNRVPPNSRLCDECLLEGARAFWRLLGLADIPTLLPDAPAAPAVKPVTQRRKRSSSAGNINVTPRITQQNK